MNATRDRLNDKAGGVVPRRPKAGSGERAWWGSFQEKRLKEKEHSVMDVTECMTELPDYACSEIGEWTVSQSAIQSQETVMTAGRKKETRSVAVTIRLRPSTKALLERQAAEEGRSVTNYLENLIVRNGEKSSQK
jgi:hypothetical protein